MPNQPRLKVSYHFVRLFRVFPRVINTIDVILRRTALDRVIVNLRNFPHLTVSRKSLVVACLFLVGIVGYIDYLTGYERSLLLFYLLPISLAAWFGSLRLGLAIAFVSVTVSKLSDLAAGIPAVGLWNAGIAFCFYALFAGVLSKLRTLVDELDRRGFQLRISALQLGSQQASREGDRYKSNAIAARSTAARLAVSVWYRHANTNN